MRRTKEQIKDIEHLTDVYLSVYEPARLFAYEHFDGQFERDERSRAVAHDVAVLWIEEQQRKGIQL